MVGKSQLWSERNGTKVNIAGELFGLALSKTSRFQKEGTLRDYAIAGLQASGHFDPVGRFLPKLDIHAMEVVLGVRNEHKRVDHRVA